jgi:hypothetical protein
VKVCEEASSFSKNIFGSLISLTITTKKVLQRKPQEKIPTPVDLNCNAFLRAMIEEACPEAIILENIPSLK